MQSTLRRLIFAVRLTEIGPFLQWSPEVVDPLGGGIEEVAEQLERNTDRSEYQQRHHVERQPCP